MNISIRDNHDGHESNYIESICKEYVELDVNLHEEMSRLEKIEADVRCEYRSFGNNYQVNNVELEVDPLMKMLLVAESEKSFGFHKTIIIDKKSSKSGYGYNLKKKRKITEKFILREVVINLNHLYHGLCKKEVWKRK
jgi:hypothetical protein